MLDILIFIFVLSILIVVHEFGHFILARKQGVRVERFSLGFGPRLFNIKGKKTEYSVSLIPLGGYVKLAGESLEEFSGKPDEYSSQSPGRRFKIIFFGPLLNYILGFLCFWITFFAGYPTLTTKVGGVLDGFGAKEAGMQVGDKILTVDGQKVGSWEDLQKIVRSKNNSDQVRLSVLRSDKELELSVRIRERKLEDQLGQKRAVGLLGISPFDEIIKVRHGIFESFFLGIDKTLDLTVMTYRGLWLMISGQLSMRESVTGPLGIFYITSQAASLGIIALLQLVAMLNISLAIFNLLPLPVLDGGHILFLGIEKIRRKPMSLKFERVVNQAGLAVILSLAVFVTYNDIARLFGDKISRFFR